MQMKYIYQKYFFHFNNITNYFIKRFFLPFESINNDG